MAFEAVAQFWEYAPPPKILFYAETAKTMGGVVVSSKED